MHDFAVPQVQKLRADLFCVPVNNGDGAAADWHAVVDEHRIASGLVVDPSFVGGRRVATGTLCSSLDDTAKSV